MNRRSIKPGPGWTQHPITKSVWQHTSGITLHMLGQEVTYEVLNVMEYTSDRCGWCVVGWQPDQIRLAWVVQCRFAACCLLPSLPPTTHHDHRP